MFASGQLFQPGVTLAVGIGGAVIAILAVLTNRWTTRMRATLDLLERLETQEYYQRRYRVFRRVRLEPEGFGRVIGLSTGDEETDRDHCLDYLNIFELVSLGIRKGILDERFFREAYEPTFIRDWYAARPLIEDMRSSTDPKKTANPHYFEQFEWLVRRWEKRAST